MPSTRLTSFELFMVLADVTKGKKDWPYFTLKKKKRELICLLIAVKPEHPLSCIENSKIYIRVEAINHI